MQAFWSRKGLLNYLLLPFSLLFGAAAALRRWLYRRGILASGHPGVPVLIVGNLTAGGSGKTPFVIWLAGWLKARGYTPGVVSRGYGRSERQTHVITDHSTAAQAGDEPLLICRQAGVPVAVGSDRLAACRALLELNPEVDILITDDGLQHYRLQRDLELVLADAEQQFGNGWLLPAGPLREPAARLQQADALILSQRGEDAGKPLAAPIPRFRVRHRAGAFRNVAEPDRVVEAAYFSGNEVEAVAGIARPWAFFAALERDGLKIRPRAFADHHAYAAGEINPAATVVMTQKDAVKCRELAGKDWWARELELAPDPELETWLAAKLAQLNAKR